MTGIYRLVLLVLVLCNGFLPLHAQSQRGVLSQAGLADVIKQLDIKQVRMLTMRDLHTCAPELAAHLKVQGLQDDQVAAVLPQKPPIPLGATIGLVASFVMIFAGAGLVAYELSKDKTNHWIVGAGVLVTLGAVGGEVYLALKYAND